MSYEDQEISTELGSPEYLYEFKLNDKKWHYTTGADEITVNGAKWKPIPISDDGVRQKGEPTSDIMVVTVPADIDIVKFYAATPPSSMIILTIRRRHEGSLDTVVAYVGEVIAVDQPRPGEARISCSTLSASLERSGLRLTWSRNCPHALYDSSCRAQKSAHAVNATIIELGQGTITADAFAAYPDGWFNGGILEWEDPDRGIETRGIEEHIGNTILMFGTVDGLRQELAVIAYPGCKRTVTECNLKFNNLPNYGGIPSMPGKSPFDGDPVF